MRPEELTPEAREWLRRKSGKWSRKAIAGEWHEGAVAAARRRAWSKGIAQKLRISVDRINDTAAREWRRAVERTPEEAHEAGVRNKRPKWESGWLTGVTESPGSPGGSPGSSPEEGYEEYSPEYTEEVE